MTALAQPLGITRGPAMADRFMLAALNNLQSHPDGTLSGDEAGWPVKRADLSAWPGFAAEPAEP